ncbi:M48 family metallopeptidase [Flammeovirga kamogawensis]|uniref:M48 family metallopeptidase n=1 Tax=Flammeovirga kamogawensis TaxID=373891 RepID=A0ABX8GWF0_9BACT|nr:M48 family metallopeptidase [Flammeovirga kamogawensis]MBB6460577.1 Zn-dependent protease with chaperone function [Flammeovirga kamogawensis]QWG07935.1 M48 family metallopeptidase [Flammeovirga kamogawensis]TRX69743.1 M48 family metallopeptidase [Flammeovirga kamogawensis]
MTSKELKLKKVHFTDINSSTWEHPADKLALKTVKSLKGFDTILKFIFSKTTEKSLRLMTLASAVRVNEVQFPKVYELLKETCQIFDIEELPELYISQNPILNAGVIGVDKPFIVLNSSTLDAFNDEELQSVIAHEIGHILSGHSLYRTLLQILLKISIFDFGIPLGGAAIMGIIMALKEWERKSELSADRAGLLAVQDPEKCIHTLMKIAGGGQIDQMHLGEFIKQAEEYHELSGVIDTTHKFLNTILQTHPFPVTRVQELLKWVQSGEYETILNGEHITNTALADDKYFKNEYKDDFKKVTEPIVETAKDATDYVKDFFNNL